MTTRVATQYAVGVPKTMIRTIEIALVSSVTRIASTRGVGSRARREGRPVGRAERSPQSAAAGTRGRRSSRGRVSRERARRLWGRLRKWEEAGVPERVLPLAASSVRIHRCAAALLVDRDTTAIS